CDESTFNAILRSSCWTRVWTVQEFANTHVSILCQNSNMVSFAGITKMMRHSSYFHGQLETHRDSYDDCQAFGHMDPLTVSHHALRLYLRLQAAELRDTIFAFRAISTNVFAKIKVDYRRPLRDLFTETSMVVITETNNLYLLYFASLERTSLEGTETGWMPSWSLDFGTKDSHESYRGAHMDQSAKYASASRGSYPLIFFPEPGISLRVLGRSVDVIGNFVSDFDPTDNSLLMKKTAMEKQPRSRVDENDTGSASSASDSRSRLMTLMENFVAIVHRKLGMNTLSEPKMVELLFELLRTVVELADNTPVPIPSLAPNATFRDFLEVLYNDEDLIFRFKFDIGEGRIFFTIDGRAGLGVPRISEGDEIFLVAGLQHPFVLRPHGDNGEYTLVGPAVVTGMMMGELWPDDEHELRDIDIV
ncbi:heterokaryon incompatibility protein 6, OR allele, partial [Colletotrichum asianum]